MKFIGGEKSGVPREFGSGGGIDSGGEIVGLKARSVKFTSNLHDAATKRTAFRGYKICVTIRKGIEKQRTASIIFGKSVKLCGRNDLNEGANGVGGKIHCATPFNKSSKDMEGTGGGETTRG